MPRSLPALFLALVCAAPSLAADPLVIDVFPGEAPGEVGEIGAETNQPARADENPPTIRTTNVTRPTLTVFPAPKETHTGASVIVCPGGGYSILAWNKEGTEVAEWLNSIGVTAFVLKYRVPKREGLEKHDLPLKDAQRAIRLVRSRCEEWDIAPDKIGILGFSAGGHLAATASTNFDRPAYERIDSIDETSGRPDFTVLVYPAYLMNETNDGLDDLIRVNEKTPPAFLAHAYDDRVTPLSSIYYFLALKQANVPAELHVYNTGGHGFGLRASEHPASTWPARCEAWLRVRGFIGQK